MDTARDGADHPRADARDDAASAGRLVALVADEAPGAVSALATALAARLTDGADEATPHARALASLARAHDDTVRQALLAVADADTATGLYDRVQAAEPWPRPEARPDGGAGLDAVLRQVVDTDGSETEPAPDPTDVHERPEPAAEDAEDPESPSRPRDAEPGEARPEGRPDTVRRRAERVDAVGQSDLFRAVQARTDFELPVVDPPAEGRYGRVVRVRGARGGEEHGLVLRLFAPAVAEDRLTERLADWAAVEDGVVPVADHGRRPRPWALTAATDRTLAALDPPPVDRVLRDARALAEGVARVHRADLVHGGLDPRAVAYPPGALERPVPALDHVGLAGLYREPLDVTDYVDPRYAAPEYFERRFGRLDHATDIYQLGTVLYRLATGHPPFEGTFADIRRQAVEDRPPAPTSVRPGLPDGFDRVVATATAKQKLTRYESATAMYRDLRTLCERHG